MDRRPSENNLPLQMQFVAAANGPNMPAAVQLRTHEQPPHSELYSAINEIKFLKDQNKSLMTENSELKKELTNKDKAVERAKTATNMLSYASKEWRMRCEVVEKGLTANTFQLQELNTKLQEQKQVLTGRQVEVCRLQEELREKTFLLEMEIQKHQATTKAHTETLQQLSRKETQLNRIEGQLKSRCDALEESHVSNSTQLQELNAKLQEQEQVLTSRQVEVRHLKEKLNHNEHVLMTAVMKRRCNTKDHVDTQDQPAQTEQELKSSWCDALEESRVANSTQLQELNIKLQEQEQVLTSRQVEVSRLQEELQEKTGLLDKEIEKHRTRTKAHVETLHQLSLKETELNRIEGQWKSRCDALEESHVSKSTQLQELNIKLQEQEQVLTSRQVEVSRLQEELQEQTGLLDREIEKRRTRTKAHVETLYQLSLNETELNRIEGQWKSRCDALEESHVSNSTQLQELNIKLQEQEQVLTSRQVEVSRLQEELQEQTCLLNREIEKHRTRTKAHVETLHQLSLKETELNRIEGQWKSRFDALEENHVSNSTQLQELNIKLQEQEQVLTSRQVEVSHLQEELQEKTGLLDREIEKHWIRTKAHVETLHQLSLKETELNRIEGQWKSRCDALEESHVSKSTQLQEVTKLAAKEEEKKKEEEKIERKREEESTKMDNDMEEIKEEGKSGERERKHTKSRCKRRARRRNH
ncbi:golgin subfamily A member 6-like protein 1 isoform X2 [Sparus aurata]|uniref:golgin subfamily A member 6-like protein 1 isoform X2 n=1 Tax=Sparus aurata TaxID=8175 RepID=UPI0011C1416C|nr:golgin subfamily A member 6-like protein 1 isoform X2 [Sparus aurata]